MHVLTIAGMCVGAVILFAVGWRIGTPVYAGLTRVLPNVWIRFWVILAMNVAYWLAVVVLVRERL